MRTCIVRVNGLAYWVQFAAGYTQNPRERAEYQTIKEAMAAVAHMDQVLTSWHSVLVVFSDDRSPPKIICSAGLPRKYLKLIMDFVTQA